MGKLKGLNTNPTRTDEVVSYAYAQTTVTGFQAIPVGGVIMFGGDTAPTGYLICNGNPISRTTYSKLFSAIGTTYGVGDGSTTFNLPNMKGRVPVGIKTGTNITTLGETGGLLDHTHTIGEHTHAQSHYHTADHTHTISHSHSIDHYHGFDSHTHTISHNHTVPPHYHGFSYSFVSGANHSHTMRITSKAASGSFAPRGGDGSGSSQYTFTHQYIVTEKTVYTDRWTGSAYYIGPNWDGDTGGWTTNSISSSNSNAAEGRPSGIWAGGTPPNLTGLYSGTTSSVNQNTSSTSITNTDSYTSNTGGVSSRTTKKTSTATTPFFTVNYVIRAE